MVGLSGTSLRTSLGNEIFLLICPMAFPTIPAYPFLSPMTIDEIIFLVSVLVMYSWDYREEAKI